MQGRNIYIGDSGKVLEEREFLIEADKKQLNRSMAVKRSEEESRQNL